MNQQVVLWLHFELPTQDYDVETAKAILTDVIFFLIKLTYQLSLQYFFCSSRIKWHASKHLVF